jgi:hypothetical protein
VHVKGEESYSRQETSSHPTSAYQPSDRDVSPYAPPVKDEVESEALAEDKGGEAN